MIYERTGVGIKDPDFRYIKAHFWDIIYFFIQHVLYFNNILFKNIIYIFFELTHVLFQL